MSKKFLGGFVVLVSFLGIAATSLAAAPPERSRTAPAPTIVQGPVPSVCPAGWHMQSGTQSQNSFVCVPTKTPVMIQCPPGLVYFDNGCNIGCDKPIK
jgi:hypothetical protein